MFLAVLVVFLSGCTNESASDPKGPPTLVRLYPSSFKAGEKFNVQPNGAQAIGADCRNVSGGAMLIVGSHNLPAVVAQGTPPNCGISAILPADVIDTPGVYPVSVKDRSGESNRLDLTVRPKQ